MEPNKDKRISWLSIFSSLNQIHSKESIKTLTKKAFILNEELYLKYPIEEENPVKVEETTEICPKCLSPKVIKQGEKNGNKWKGLFCSNPECDEKPKWLNTESPESNAYPKPK